MPTNQVMSSCIPIYLQYQIMLERLKITCWDYFLSKPTLHQLPLILLCSSQIGKKIKQPLIFKKCLKMTLLYHPSSCSFLALRSCVIIWEAQNTTNSRNTLFLDLHFCNIQLLKSSFSLSLNIFFYIRHFQFLERQVGERRKQAKISYLDTQIVF